MGQNFASRATIPVAGSQSGDPGWEDPIKAS